MKWLLLVAVLGLVPQSPHKIESKYDRFTDKTTVRLRFVRVFQAPMRSILLDASYQYKGKGEQIDPPDAIWLDFVSTGDDRFYENTKLYILHDDERSEYVADNRRGLYAIAFAQFEKIINSKKIEVRLGDVELTLTDETIKALRDFIPKALPK